LAVLLILLTRCADNLCISPQSMEAFIMQLKKNQRAHFVFGFSALFLGVVTATSCNVALMQDGAGRATEPAQGADSKYDLNAVEVSFSDETQGAKVSTNAEDHHQAVSTTALTNSEGNSSSSPSVGIPIAIEAATSKYLSIQCMGGQPQPVPMPYPDGRPEPAIALDNNQAQNQSYRVGPAQPPRFEYLRNLGTFSLELKNETEVVDSLKFEIKCSAVIVRILKSIPNGTYTLGGNLSVADGAEAIYSGTTAPFKVEDGLLAERVVLKMSPASNDILVIFPQIFRPGPGIVHGSIPPSVTPGTSIFDNMDPHADVLSAEDKAAQAACQSSGKFYDARRKHCMADTVLVKDCKIETILSAISSSQALNEKQKVFAKDVLTKRPDVINDSALRGCFKDKAEKTFYALTHAKISGSQGIIRLLAVPLKK
jgi:hypothetical protein